MLKQWENTSLGCSYVFLKENNSSGSISTGSRVLTSDGVLLNYEEFKNLTQNQYEVLRKTKYKYDYQLTIQTEKLTKAVSNKQQPNPAVMAKKLLHTNKNETALEESEKPEEVPVNPIPKVETIIKTVKASTAKICIINVIERIIMLCISIMAIILSIYYTRTLLIQTNSKLIATLLSVSMLLYSLVGLQFIPVFKKKKNYIKVVLLFTTSIMTLIFSMFTSLDVNIAHYLANNKVIEQEQRKTNSSVLILENIKEQKEQNRKTVEMLMQDIEYYASRKLNTYTQREQIKQLDAEYKELSQQEIEILNGNTAVSENLEKKKTAPTSLVEIIGSLIGVDKNIVQMFIMCFASIFIDIIAPLALNIAIFGKLPAPSRE